MLTLNSALRRAAQQSPSTLALLAPQQQAAWSYQELETRVRRLAGGLRELGLAKGNIVVSDLPNVCENLLLQLACSHLGASFATAKDEQALAKVGQVQCVAADSNKSWLWNFAQQLDPATTIPPLCLNTTPGFDKFGFYSFNEIASHAEDPEDAAAFPDGILGSYNGSTMTHAQAVLLGQEAAAALQTSAADKSCVSITFCHAFGMGSGVGSALMSGSTVVLPAVGGIRGCGDPKQRASVTAKVLQETESTLLFADTHILKQMPPSSGISALRGGLVKVASGTAIFDGGLSYGSASLLSIGKKPS